MLLTRPRAWHSTRTAALVVLCSAAGCSTPAGPNAGPVEGRWAGYQRYTGSCSVGNCGVGVTLSLRDRDGAISGDGKELCAVTVQGTRRADGGVELRLDPVHDCQNPTTVSAKLSANGDTLRGMESIVQPNGYPPATATFVVARQ